MATVTEPVARPLAVQAAEAVVRRLRFEVALRQRAWREAEQEVVAVVRDYAPPKEGETSAEALRSLVGLLRHGWETATWFDRDLEALPRPDRDRLRLERIIAYGELCNRAAALLEEEARRLDMQEV